MLQREKLVQYQGASLTSDTIEALRQLEFKVGKNPNIKLSFSGLSRDRMTWKRLEDGSLDNITGQPAPGSMALTGREIYLTLNFKEDPLVDRKTVELRELATLWSFVVPLGFTPWDRNPVVSPTSQVFHYNGPWNRLYDSLLSQGRGEFAFPSVCCAAQVDVGLWQGAHSVERFVQAQLHRIGMDPGPVDGTIQEKTLNAIQATGMVGKNLTELADVLARRESFRPVTSERSYGHVILPGHQFTIFPSGGIKSTRNQSGAQLTIDGPGGFTVVLEEQSI